MNVILTFSYHEEQGNQHIFNSFFGEGESERETEREGERDT